MTNLGMNSNLQRVAVRLIFVLGFSDLQHKKRCIGEEDLSDFLLYPVETTVTMYAFIFFFKPVVFLVVFTFFILLTGFHNFSFQ